MKKNRPTEWRKERDGRDSGHTERRDTEIEIEIDR